MANGTIAFDTLQTSGQITGTAKSLDTDYVVNGSARMYATINGTGTISTYISLNVSSLTDDGVGEPWCNVTNSFSSSTSYAVAGATNPSSTFNDTVCWNQAGGASQVRIFTGADASQLDINPVGVTVLGDLA